jgi:hypothetical protein
MRLLLGNRLGNTRETLSFLAGNFKDTGGLFCGAVEIVTPEGDRVWIATDDDAVKLIPSGAVCFLGDEIMELQKAGKEAARAALMVKQVFPFAVIDRFEVNDEKHEAAGTYATR